MSEKRKPLELKVYPIWESGFGDLYADKDDPQHPTRVDFEVYRKRLTETQLATEYEASRCDAMVAFASGSDSYWAPLGETWPNTRSAANDRTRTLFRFATNPHHDEGES